MGHAVLAAASGGNLATFEIDPNVGGRISIRQGPAEVYPVSAVRLLQYSWYDSFLLKWVVLVARRFHL